MFAPQWVCRQLANLHPHLRLAWMGRPPAYEGELDPGQFVLIQLFHIRDCGSMDDPLCYQEFWQAETVLDQLRAPHNVRVERGVVFNKTGGTRPDWDPLFRKPIMMVGVDGAVGLQTRDVYNGKLLRWVKSVLLPSEVRKQLRKMQLKEQGKNLDRKVDDICGEMASVLWHEANKTGETGLMTARKHIEEDAGLRAYRDGDFVFEDYYMRNAPK